MTDDHEATGVGGAPVHPASAAVQATFYGMLAQCGGPRRRPARVDRYGNLAGYRNLPDGSSDASAKSRLPLADAERVDLVAEISDLEGRLALYKQRCDALAETNDTLRRIITGEGLPVPSTAPHDASSGDLDETLSWMGAMSRDEFSDTLGGHPVPSLGGSHMPHAAGFTAYPNIRGVHTSIPFWCERQSLAHSFGVLEIAFHKGFCWLTVVDYPGAAPELAFEVQKILWANEVRD